MRNTNDEKIRKLVLAAIRGIGHRLQEIAYDPTTTQADIDRELKDAREILDTLGSIAIFGNAMPGEEGN